MANGRTTIVERRQFVGTFKQRVSADDEFYLQLGHLKTESGDVADHYDSARAILGFRAEEKQEPTLYAGWHHSWSPGVHTLLLFARLDDRLSYTNPQPNVTFLQTTFGSTNIQTAGFFPPFRLDYANEFTLYSGELQQLFQTERHSFVLGGRWQSGTINTHSILQQDPIGPGFIVFSNSQAAVTQLQRGNVYGYYSWQVWEPLRLIGGVSYDHVQFPENLELPPISGTITHRDQVSPKAGLLLAPWKGGLVRASYTKSLGGLFFDNSVRLEPTQVGGFNQAFRSLVPESVEGVVPSTEFETAAAGFDQTFAGGTWFGAEAEWLTSHASRALGLVANSFPLGEPDSSLSTRQTLAFRERNLSAYIGQLLGNHFAVSARYRLSEATLRTRFPEIPDSTGGLVSLEQDNRAVLHQLALDATFAHPSGFFSQWESAWYLQSNSGYNSVVGANQLVAGSSFWQHHAAIGYRFPRRYAEVRLGLANIFDRDYRLNPLNLHPDLWRGRTLTVSLRLNF
jgi:hypothetical protein